MKVHWEVESAGLLCSISSGIEGEGGGRGRERDWFIKKAKTRLRWPSGIDRHFISSQIGFHGQVEGSDATAAERFPPHSPALLRLSSPWLINTAAGWEHAGKSEETLGQLKYFIHTFELIWDRFGTMLRNSAGPKHVRCRKQRLFQLLTLPLQSLKWAKTRGPFWGQVWTTYGPWTTVWIVSLVALKTQQRFIKLTAVLLNVRCQDLEQFVSSFVQSF